MGSLFSGLQKTINIEKLKLSIYDEIEVGDPNLWLTSDELTAVLNNKLVGESFHGMAIRTRSKVAKELVARNLGYKVPTSFKKCQPRFLGQKFDTYVQKSDNLQIWNEELDIERRYVLIRTDDNDIVTKVRVVSGSDLSDLDTTGTLTQKFQARLVINENEDELISELDTGNLRAVVGGATINLSNSCPISSPEPDLLLPIECCFTRLKNLVGSKFRDAGATQERNRGGALHALVCEALGYQNYLDNGQFPDIRHQLLEVKLQTSPTIDLGLICPNSDALLDIEQIEGIQVRHCDVRYAIFCGFIENGFVHITNFYLTTGEDFFSRFTQFGGKVSNKKIQIPLPRDFFN